MAALDPIHSAKLAASRALLSDRDQQHTLFARTMGYVALTVGLFAVGAYLGRDLPGGVGVLAFIASIGCLIGLQYAVSRSTQTSVVLLVAFGLLVGLAAAPSLGAYAEVDPQVLWQAGVATGLFIAGFGAAGYATRTDRTRLARLAFWALLGLIAFGIVLIFVQVPGGALIYCLLGLTVFAVLTAVDFACAAPRTSTQRLSWRPPSSSTRSMSSCSSCNSSPAAGSDQGRVET